MTLSRTELGLKFNPSDEEIAFYKRNTGIQDDDRLREHIVGVAQKALEPDSKRRIRNLMKPNVWMEWTPKWISEVRLLLDVRKAIEDGYPARNIIASDLRPEFWNFGHELFKTDPQTFPVTFIPGDVLDASFISIQPPLQIPLENSIVNTTILQTNAKSLDFLRGHLSAIHTSAFFHLFGKDEQLIIAKKLASLLSPLPGSIIFGSHVGGSEALEGARNGTGTMFYRHSPETWREMWEKQVFGGEGQVRVEAEIGGNLDDRDARIMIWSVVRV